MQRAVLFDLDDTLLGNAMSTFLPAYFGAIARWVGDLVAPDLLIGALLQGTAAMGFNDGNGPTNEEAFAAVFYPMVGLERETLQPVFESFYREAFPALRPLTTLRPEAFLLVRAAFAAGMQVAVATNPVFPRSAIEQRLEWAGVGSGTFRFDVVTSYETSHATKPHAAYYSEILARLDRLAGECLMVGDSWELDIVPAIEAGMAAFWVRSPSAPGPPARAALVGYGTLADLWRSVREANGRFPGNEQG